LCATITGNATETREHRTFAPLDISAPLDPEKVALGRMLFSDPILSSRQMISCSSCHDLNEGGTVRLPRTVGYDGKEHRFNAPTIFNVAKNYLLGWRGEFKSLEALNEKVLLDVNLMAADWAILEARLSSSPIYSQWFNRIYGHGPDRVSLLDALVTFQRSLITPNARFDTYLRGDSSALRPAELEGLHLFMSYGCASCHQGMNLGGNMMQKFGIFPPTSQLDAVIVPSEGKSPIGHGWDESLFRVPSLRNVAVTGPYFHDGRVESLSEAVSIMGQRQLGRTLSSPEIEAIVAFLNTLTGEYDGRKLHATAPATANNR
ncbi:cytochrome-c peroxidase, partial [Microvirga roseola]|uniref:cytochrome-c peroxidase n=1 Tax=Microvirga roseola TaxID=2883126 RepID=UPI001E60581B